MCLCLISDIIKALLKVTFSVENQRRAAEEQAYIYFCDFLDECEGWSKQCNIFIII